jgi:hypothetical protein
VERSMALLWLHPGGHSLPGPSDRATLVCLDYLTRLPNLFVAHDPLRQRQCCGRCTAVILREGCAGARGVVGGLIEPVRMELSRTFKYFAYEGATGEERWKNAASDFHHDLNALSQVDPLLLVSFFSSGLFYVSLSVVQEGIF